MAEMSEMLQVSRGSIAIHQIIINPSGSDATRPGIYM